MEYRKSLFLLFCAMSVGGACAPPAQPVDTSSAEAAIQQFRSDYIAAYQAQDVAALTNMYTESGVVSMPNQAPVSGKAAIQALFEATFAMGQVTLYISSEDLRICGDWVVDSGTSKVEIAPPDGPQITQNSSYTAVLVRQADDWKLSRVILSSDDPLPSPEGSEDEQ